jgi:hypothetical protein
LRKSRGEEDEDEGSLTGRRRQEHSGRDKVTQKEI